MKVDPFDPENHNHPLWLVYGVECNPQIVCCRLKGDLGKTYIWGFSVYEGVAGFRTMGFTVRNWMNKTHKMYGWDMFEFYDDQDEALERLRQLTDPVYQGLIAQKEAA